MAWHGIAKDTEIAQAKRRASHQPSNQMRQATVAKTVEDQPEAKVQDDQQEVMRSRKDNDDDNEDEVDKKT